MRLLCEFPVGTLRNAVTPSSIALVAKGVRNMPGIGKPFLIFATLSGAVGSVNFELYTTGDDSKPIYIVSGDEAENVAMIDAMLANPPLDAVTFP